MIMKLFPVLLAQLIFLNIAGQSVRYKNKGQTAANSEKYETICNPMNLSYRFRLEEPSRREAADPTVILFKDKYFLFASKSGGYWYSFDLIKWNFIKTNEIPTENYAPTAVVIGDTVYFMASGKKNTVYKSSDPMTGKWTMAKDSLERSAGDPDFFLDTDNRLYLYYGLSNKYPIHGVEVDKNNFTFIGDPKDLIFGDPQAYGWEVRGDYNTSYDKPPFIEGSWMNKYKGKYYLQFASPGTQFKSYCDAVYISDNPLGPFKISLHNPYSYKPEGFADGAGHGSTFKDKYGNYWHVGTITVSVKHKFERRLGFYPVGFDEDGILYSTTKYGDYPLIVPQKKINSFSEIFPGWMLLSYKKKVNVSSSVESHPSLNMVDENIRTYWAAKSGNSTEWASIDLGAAYDVYAVQINFAEDSTKIFGRMDSLCYRYIVEVSKDNKRWKIIIDKSMNEYDNSHDYTQLKQKINCRYLRIKNIKVPGGDFAISGFRVFGKGNGAKPSAVTRLQATRNPADKRSVQIKWEASKNATGYDISYGEDKNKLYHNYMVYKDTTVDINSLSVNSNYYFTIESFNENGIKKSGLLIKAE